MHLEEAGAEGQGTWQWAGGDKWTDELRFLSARDQERAADSISEVFWAVSVPSLSGSSGRGQLARAQEAKEPGSLGRAQPAAAPPTPTTCISGASRFPEKHLWTGQGWSWEFVLEKPRDAGAEWGGECYHRNLIFLHSISSPSAP